MKTRLMRAIDHVGQILPAQGPITVFVHHNTLHAFEEEPFEEAAIRGARLFGCEPFLSEEAYRLELRRGRIRPSDLEAVIDRDLEPTAGDAVCGFVSRRELRLEWLRHGVPEARGAALEWLLSETDVLDVARSDLSAVALERLVGMAETPDAVSAALRSLWDACLGVVRRAPRERGTSPTIPLRHSEILRAVTGVDPDELVNPLLIRLCAAYLDQGVAVWSMPDRHLGFHLSVARLYGLPFGPPGGWKRRARGLLAEDASSGRSVLESVEHSLELLGVPPEEWEGFLTSSALVLRGWAGMMQQMETRPDRMPVQPVPATLADFLAVRLLLDRAAVSEVARTELGAETDLATLRGSLIPRLRAPSPEQPKERAWPLFHLSQVLGRNAADVLALDEEGSLALLGEIDSFDGLRRRRLLHLAYERRLRHRLYDSLVSHPAPPARKSPTLQAIFCIDEREESIRRHLEEVAPQCETFGAAGFFGVAMYYRGTGEVHSRPLCPVGVQPDHEVVEVGPRDGDTSRLRRRLRRTWGHIALAMAVGSRSTVRGTLATVGFGVLAAVPLVLRVFSPRLSARLAHRGRWLLQGEGPGSMTPERSDRTAGRGRYSGFTVDEMAAIVRRLLEDVGLRSFAPIVLIVGHGSTSLNNPHESAHDCSACGGGRGGPNARAFAAMANHPEVRRRLAAAGVTIPSGTWFVGAEHNTASDSMTYHDLHIVPAALEQPLREAMQALEESRRRNAHERCRRFLSVPLGSPEDDCLAHVETRSEDLAQTRPEYGHATNAFCIVGRRRRTRGLFLDRRAFLVSYDPELDDGRATNLSRTLAGIVPVVAGINLEYYFASVDETGYGCGTKLPHNVTGLIGVMDGHASDLRSGLPRQMFEIHEPVRLTVVVEATPDVILRLVRENATLQRLVTNRWISMAALEPDTPRIHRIEEGCAVPYAVEEAWLGIVGTSAQWYGGRRGFLRFARIGVPQGPEWSRSHGHP